MFFASGAFADVNSTFETNTSLSHYSSDYGIYVYGDVQSIQNAFTFVQAIAQSNMLEILIALVMLFQLPYSSYQFFQSQSGVRFIANLTFVTASALTLVTDNISTTVHIEDLRVETNYSGLPAKTYAAVDGIPLPIAIVTSTISTFADSMKTLYRDAAGLIEMQTGASEIGDVSALSVGYAGAIGDMLKVTQLASFNTEDGNASTYAKYLSLYISDCAIAQAVAITPSKVNNILNPTGSLIESISPTTLSILGSAYEINYQEDDGPHTDTCQNYYDNKIGGTAYDDQAQNLIDRLSKATTSGLSDNVIVGLSKMSGIEDSIDVADSVGKFKAYAMNLAATGPINSAFRNMNVDLLSGQDVANAITAASSLADIQSEGAGKFKWMAEVLPMGFHYMLGIIYSVSIIVMLVATAIGFEKGIMIWKNFTKGLLVFQFVDVALVIVDSSINQYLSAHAADLIASIGQNPSSIQSIPQYWHYLSTMAGISGIVGTAAVFMIPSMMFAGEVAGAMGAIQGSLARYKGNDTNTATSESAKQKATKDAWERELHDQAMLDNMGLRVPTGMGATDYYNELKRGAEMSSAGFGAAAMGSDAIGASAHAMGKGGTMQSIASGATMDAGLSMNDFANAGHGQGLQGVQKTMGMSSYGNNMDISTARIAGEAEGVMQAKGVQATADASSMFGNEALGAGAYNQNMQKMAGMATFGAGATQEDAVKSGIAQGLKQTGVAQADSHLLDRLGSQLQSAAMTNSIAKGLDEAKQAKALQSQFGEDLGGVGTFERKELTQDAQSKIDEHQRVIDDKNMSKAQKDMALSGISQVKNDKDSWTTAQESMTYDQMASNEASSKLASRMGGAKAFDDIGHDMQASNAQFGALSQALTTAAKIQQQGGLDNALKVDVADARIKAAEQAETIGNRLKEADAKDGLDSSADKIASAIEKLANTTGTMVGSKTRSDMRSIDTAGGSEEYKEMSAGKSAKMTSSTIESLSAEKTAGLINEDGTLTDMGALGTRIDTLAKTMPMLNRAGVFSSKQARENAANSMAKAALGENASQQAIDNFLKNEGLDNVGSMSAEQFASEIFGRQGTVFASHAQIAGKDGAMYTLAFNEKGGMGKRVSGFSGITDNTQKDLAGEKYDGQIRKATHDGISGMLEILGVDAQTADDIASGVIAGWDGAGEAVLGTAAMFGGAGVLYGAKKKLSKASQSDSPTDLPTRNQKNPATDTKTINDTNSAHSKADISTSSTKDIPNSTINTEDVKGYKTTDSGILVPDNYDTSSPKTKGGGFSNIFDGVTDLFSSNAGKQALRSMPFVGTAAGLVFAGQEAMAGNFERAGLELVSATADMVPGVGTAIGLSADAALMAGVGLPNQNPIANTSRAMISDQGLPAAIDSYNTTQNIQAMDTARAGVAMPMQTRSGQMSFSQSSKNGNLAVTLPGEDFKTHTNIPFGEFQSMMSDPAMQQQFAQMVAQSSFDGNTQIGDASSMEQFKQEMQNSFQTMSHQNTRLGIQTDSSTMLTEEVMAYTMDNADAIDELGGIQEDIMDRLDSLSEK
jgi:hypothetical protein